MMLGTQLYIQCTDDTPAGLQRTLGLLRKELESREISRINERILGIGSLAGDVAGAGSSTNGAGRTISNSSTASAVGAKGGASGLVGGDGLQKIIVEEASPKLSEMTLEQVCAWCQKQSLSEAVEAVRRHGLDGRALTQLLLCKDIHTYPTILQLQTSMHFPSVGVVLRFLYELEIELHKFN